MYKLKTGKCSNSSPQSGKRGWRRRCPISAQGGEKDFPKQTPFTRELKKKEASAGESQGPAGWRMAPLAPRAACAKAWLARTPSFLQDNAGT